MWIILWWDINFFINVIVYIIIEYTEYRLLMSTVWTKTNILARVAVLLLNKLEEVWPPTFTTFFSVTSFLSLHYEIITSDKIKYPHKQMNVLKYLNEKMKRMSDLMRINLSSEPPELLVFILLFVSMLIYNILTYCKLGMSWEIEIIFNKL